MNVRYRQFNVNDQVAEFATVPSYQPVGKKLRCDLSRNGLALRSYLSKALRCICIWSHHVDHCQKIFRPVVGDPQGKRIGSVRMNIRWKARRGRRLRCSVQRARYIMFRMALLLLLARMMLWFQHQHYIMNEIGEQKAATAVLQKATTDQNQQPPTSTDAAFHMETFKVSYSDAPIQMSVCLITMDDNLVSGFSCGSTSCMSC